MRSALVLAIEWSPFFRGILMVLVGVVVLMGSTYVILMTNLGSRLGFLVAFAALFGWIFLLGSIWWAYGIGLRGKDPSWTAMEIIVGPELLAENEIVGGSDLAGWTELSVDDPQRGQAVASADEILVNEAGVFAAGEYVATRVFDKGGERRPTLDLPVIGEFDLFAFWHYPRYALVEVYPVVKQTTEPGRAPPSVEADRSQPPRYVLMQRNKGNRRRPAAFVTIGSGIIFGVTCYALHRRDKLSTANRSEEVEQPREPAGAGV